MNNEQLLKKSVQLAIENKKAGGRPFGALVVCDGEIVATGVNRIHKTNDPTSHAELEAIKRASKKLGRADLSGCVVFASGHPCPMCLGALATSKIETVYYAFDNNDARPFGFSSEGAYEQLNLELDQVRLKRIKLDLGMKAEELYAKD